MVKLSSDELLEVLFNNVEAEHVHSIHGKLLARKHVLKSRSGKRKLYIR